MKKILLTGAGFSRNWGAWLANEAFEFLLSCHLNDSIRSRLWADWEQGLAFEHTLGLLQARASHDPQARQDMEILNAALVDMFEMIDHGLLRTHPEMEGELVRLLPQFDAIFTLNQDLILERRYHTRMVPHPPGLWVGGYSPGIGPPGPSPFSGDPDWLIGAKRSPIEPERFLIPPQIQPYFKLHGSSNWYQDKDSRLLVMGTNKAAAIQSAPLLKWYFEEFERYLQAGNTRLMVIGYSFRDQHINDAIATAVPTKLKIFVVDPRGLDVLDDRDPRAVIGPRPQLVERLKLAVEGASRRDLSNTLKYDRVELAKFTRFLANLESR